MSSENHTTLLVTATFMLVFFILAASMPASLLVYQEAYTQYSQYVPPSRWQLRDLSLDALTSVILHEDFDIDFPERYLTVNVTSIIDYVEWGYVIGVPNQNQIVIFFTKMPSVKYAAQRDYVLGLEDEDGYAMIYLSKLSYDYDIRLSFYYDADSYDSLAEAWDDGHLWILIEVYEAQEGAMRYNLWWLIGQFMLFQSPEIHPAINALIAIPIWVSIIYCAMILLLYIKDLVWPV